MIIENLKDLDLPDLDLPEFNSVPEVDETTEKTRKLLQSRAFNFDNPPPKVPPVYTLAGTGIAHPGNLILIVGDRGAGKSSFFAAGLAAPMVEDEEADCLGFASQNPEGKAVVHIDTEQSLQHFDALVRRSLRRAGREKPPEWLQSVCLTGCSPLEIVQALRVLLADASSRHKGVHSVWLDGVGDVVNSTNDEGEAILTVRQLHALAIEFDCPIFSVLHLNPGSDFKSRGHLGSHYERKAETVLKLKKDIIEKREVVTAFTGKARECPIPEWTGPRFTWSDQDGMHISCGSKSEARSDKRKSELFELALAVWEKNPDAILPHKEVVSRIQEVTSRDGKGRGGNGLKERAAKDRVVQMIYCTAIEKCLVNGHYQLSQDAKSLLH